MLRRLAILGSKLHVSSVMALLRMFAVRLKVLAHWPRQERLIPRTESRE